MGAFQSQSSDPMKKECDVVHAENENLKQSLISLRQTSEASVVTLERLQREISACKKRALNLDDIVERERNIAATRETSNTSLQKLLQESDTKLERAETLLVENKQLKTESDAIRKSSETPDMSQKHVQVLNDRLTAQSKKITRLENRVVNITQLCRNKLQRKNKRIRNLNTRRPQTFTLINGEKYIIVHSKHVRIDIPNYDLSHGSVAVLRVNYKLPNGTLQSESRNIESNALSSFGSDDKNLRWVAQQHSLLKRSRRLTITSKDGASITSVNFTVTNNTGAGLTSVNVFGDWKFLHFRDTFPPNTGLERVGPGGPSSTSDQRPIPIPVKRTEVRSFTGGSNTSNGKGTMKTSRGV